MYPEKDFGDGATFQWFIQEVRARYPSGRLAVSVWDHGYGWRYFAADDTSGGDRITMDEFRSALANAGVTVDLLAFDCCNMANTEVAYEAARSGKVGILVASEETVPQNGYPYDLMLAPVAADPTRTPAQVGADMVAGWKTYYDAQTWAPGAHLAAIDLARLDSATADLQNWATLLRIDLAASREGITAAAEHVLVRMGHGLRRPRRPVPAAGGGQRHRGPGAQGRVTAGRGGRGGGAHRPGHGAGVRQGHRPQRLVAQPRLVGRERGGVLRPGRLRAAAAHRRRLVELPRRVRALTAPAGPHVIRIPHERSATHQLS